jgi:hypothetical protein
MKSHSYTSILLGILAATTIFSLVMCGWYIHSVRQARILQRQFGAINVRQAGVRQLIEETAEYARRTNNKEALQILESVGVKLVSQNASGTSGAK